jgi:septin family protein
MTESTEERVTEAKESMTVLVCGSFRSGKSAFIASLFPKQTELELLGESLERSGFDCYFEEEENSEFDSQLDDILTELHASDERIAAYSEDIVLLGKETRAILTDLSKRLG